MKTFFQILSLCLLLSGAAEAKEFSSAKRKPTTLEAQLEQYISFPKTLLTTDTEGIVSIQFSTDANNRIYQVYVISQNTALTSELTSQLLGRKLSGVDPHETYAIRLRFRFRK